LSYIRCTHSNGKILAPRKGGQQKDAAHPTTADITTLISDYNFLADEPAVRLVQQALVLAAHVLREDKTQLSWQLHGRLLSQNSPDIQGLLKCILPPFPWLRPLRTNLAQAGGALISTLSGHSSAINAL
jgi:hypothetical protein